MIKDTKVLFLGIVLTLLLIVGGAFVVSNKNNDSKNQSSEVLGLEVIPLTYELGSVPIEGGIVTRQYEVKNTTDKLIKLKKIATSCMCTTASLSIGDKSTKYFGMEMGGDKNPQVNIEIPAGTIGKVSVQFDPAAHGPQGIGPFNRVVYLTFSDPAGIKELTFSGTVVN